MLLESMCAGMEKCQSEEACRGKKERKSEIRSEPIEISQESNLFRFQFMCSVIHSIPVFSRSVE